MNKLFLSFIVACSLCPSAFGVTDLKQAKFTQVINDVQIVSTADHSKTPAVVDAPFKTSDALRTGPASRAELAAADQTLTRVGANTIISFDAASRSYDLEQGSVLLDSPKGSGSAFIHATGASVSVSGGTIIIAANSDGGCKILALAGVADVRFRQGLHERLHGGEMIAVAAGQSPGPLLTFRLDQEIANSKLVSGFAHSLPSLSRINTQIARQTQQLKTGRAQDIGEFAQALNPIQQINGAVSSIAGIDPVEFFPGGHPVPASPPVGNGPQPPLPIGQPSLPPLPISGPQPQPPIILQNQNLSTFPNLTLSGRTIILMNVTLPGSGATTFDVANGVLAPNPNTGQQIIQGDINFIQNVTYQGTLANTPGVGFRIGHVP